MPRQLQTCLVEGYLSVVNPMTATYGSHNLDSIKVEHLDGLVRSKSSLWKKTALAIAGAALCLGGALVMYEGWNIPFSGINLATTGSVSPVTLESAVTSTDQTKLMSGQPILLRTKGKIANLCADDGGSTKPDVSFVTGQPCNPSNPNQLFIYDSTTHQFKSAKKANLCLDDGGGWAGLTWFRLSTCNVKSDDQRLTYDATTHMFENPSKKGFCMGDGGATTSGTTKFTSWYCSEKNNNQRFEVLSQSTLAAEQKKVLEAVAGGANFILRIAGKEGLCAAGAGTATASTKFVPAACDKTSKYQLFSYDASIKRFKAAEKSGLCLDDGGGVKAAKTSVRLSSCSTTSVDQLFTYDPATMLFNQPNKPKLCLDDGSSIWLTAPRLILKECDAYSANQHFEAILQTDPVIVAPVVTTTSTSVETSAPQAASNPVVSNPTIISPSVQQSEPATTTVVAAETPLAATLVVATTTTPTSVETSAPQAATDSLVSNPTINSPNDQQTESTTTTVPTAAIPITTMSTLVQTSTPQAATYSVVSSPTAEDTGTSTQQVVPYAETTTPVPSSTEMLNSPSHQETQTSPRVESTSPISQSTTTTTMTNPEPSPTMTSTTIDPDATKDKQGNTLTSTSTQLEPEIVSAQQGETVASTSTQPGMTESGIISSRQGETAATTSTEPELVSTPIETSSMTEPELVSAQQGETGTSTLTEPGISSTQQGETVASTSSTSMTEAEHYTTPDQQGETNPSTATEPDMTTAQNSEVTSTGISAANPWHDDDIPSNPVELPDQVNADVPLPNVPVVKKADMPLADYGTGDWNLLAPSNETISIVNTDNSPAISAAEIFQYLQAFKDRADVKQEVMMYRYQRTYQCVSAGLQTLAKVAVTSDEYQVLVQWMYDHCAAGATDVAPITNPSPPTDKQTKKEDVAPLVDDKDTDVKRQFMTKLDFYYEIKTYFAKKNEKLVGDAAVTNLRSEEVLALDKKLVDCIEEASDRYQEGEFDEVANHLKSVINWLEATCMAL